MNDPARRGVERAAGIGVDIVRRKAAFYAGLLMAVVVGGLALLVVLILALVGHGPNPAVALLIILGTAFVGGVAARAAVLRISLMAALAMAIRYVSRRAGRGGR